MTKHVSHTALMGNYRPLERKDGAAGVEFKELGNKLMSTFEAFKSQNDAELADLKKKIGGGDVVMKEHTDRINAAISEVEAKMQAEILEIKRAAILSKVGADGKQEAPEITAYRKQFDSYLRKGGERTEETLRELHAKAVEAKALSTNSEADGGFTVVPQIEQTMIELSLLVSPIRALGSVQTIGAGSLKVPVNKRGTAAGWVGETDPRAQTATSQLAELEFVPGELYAMPAATQQMLDDSFINVEAWIASEAALKFAQVEGQGFISGDGVKKPKGFLAYPVVADASWSWGNVGYIPTTTSGDFNSGTYGDAFFDVIGALRYPYRPGASFVTNRRTVARMRKIKTSYGEYLWQPGLLANQPSSFAGFPLNEAEDMPDAAANSYSIIFGDMKQFYKIVDRMGVRTLRDPYTLKPYILFYMTKRVGGGIQNFEAAKIMKFSVS